MIGAKLLFTSISLLVITVVPLFVWEVVKMGPPRIELGSYGPHPQRIPLPHGPVLGSMVVFRLRVSFHR